MTELELRQQPNNLNAMVAQRAVQAVISRVGSAAEIADQQRGRGRADPAFATPRPTGRPISTRPWTARRRPAGRAPTA